MTDRTGQRLYARERDAAELPLNRGRDRAEALRSLTAGRSVVYAMRLPDGTIKIGCSAQLWRRRCTLRGEVLAFVNGTRIEEQAIHRTLTAHLARGREYYRPTPAVLAVVNDMRKRFNLPPLAA